MKVEATLKVTKTTKKATAVAMMKVRTKRRAETTTGKKKRMASTTQNDYRSGLL